MTEQQPGIDHNSAGATVATDHGPVAGDRLLQLVERVERLEEEKKVLMEDIKEVYAEAKAVGFDVKIMRKLVAIRRMESHKRNEEFELLKLYCAAVGIEW